ncbi:hypothetical protein IV83_GL000229 [Pediococcus inopinatus]|nr:hypothetical protein IV83_GL000229 [Pediococcus inopinatus]
MIRHSSKTVLRLMKLIRQILTILIRHSSKTKGDVVNQFNLILTILIRHSSKTLRLARYCRH